MKYIVVSEPHSKPIRKMIVENDVIIAKGMKPAQATRIVSALRLADARKEEYNTFLHDTKCQGI